MSERYRLNLTDGTAIIVPKGAAVHEVEVLPDGKDRVVSNHLRLGESFFFEDGDQIKSTPIQIKDNTLPGLHIQRGLRTYILVYRSGAN
jgi:hypothetical protein